MRVQLNRDVWLKTGEVARMLGVSDSLVRNLANLGQLKCAKLGTRHRLFLRREIEVWAEKHGIPIQST